MVTKAAAAWRTAALEGISVLSASALAQALAADFLRTAVMPRNAAIDAVHVALATTHGMDFLVTWNCTHIANAIVRAKIETVCRKAGFQPPGNMYAARIVWGGVMIRDPIIDEVRRIRDRIARER